jgi:hypothetical protein
MREPFDRRESITSRKHRHLSFLIVDPKFKIFESVYGSEDSVNTSKDDGDDEEEEDDEDEIKEDDDSDLMDKSESSESSLSSPASSISNKFNGNDNGGEPKKKMRVRKLRTAKYWEQRQKRMIKKHVDFLTKYDIQEAIFNFIKFDEEDFMIDFDVMEEELKQ